MLSGLDVGVVTTSCLVVDVVRIRCKDWFRFAGVVKFSC